MKVESLQDYLILLGLHALSIKNMVALQAKATRLGILEADELEAAQTIRHLSDRLVTAMSDQCHLVGLRVPEGWDGIMQEIKEKLTIKETP